MKMLFDDALDQYSASLRTTGLAKQTVYANEQSVRGLLTVCGNIFVHNINDMHVSRLFAEKSKTRGPSSMKVTHSHLSNFFTWCERNNYRRLGSNPMTGRRQPRVVEQERHRIPTYRFPELLTLAGEKDPRDRALVAVGLFALLRDQEMASLRIRDVDLGASKLFAKITKSYVEDLVPVSPALDGELRRWLTTYQASVGYLDPNYYLLPNTIAKPVNGPDGRIITHQRIGYSPTVPIRKSARIVTPLLEAFGVETRDEDGKSNREGAHTLRRSGARAMYDAMLAAGCADALRLVQVTLHHKSIQQTQKYIGLSPDRERRDSIISGLKYGFEDIPTIGKETHDGTIAPVFDVRGA